METIKVNMTPCEDVQTIHASQNDNEAREWGFELHNNGEKIDSSSISDQLVFKAYEGGTEEILPTNGSTPTTSPFKGDIRYPQGLLSDQEFLYRESPTEEDGLAKITDIKGNTLVWNQLANVGTLSATASYSGYLNIGTFSFVANRKYLIKYHQDNAMASNSRNTLQVRFNTVGISITQNANPNANLSKGDYYWLYTSANTDADTRVRIWIADNDVAVSYSNIMIFDLTKMGLDITDPSEFTSLFPLSYYSYNQGTLLSFMGNGIKTVGFNQWDEEWEVGSINSAGQNTAGTSTIRSKNYISVFPNTSYFVRTGDSADTIGAFIYFYDADKNYLSFAAGVNTVITTPNECRYIRFRMYDPQYGTVYKGNICINISDTSKNGTYEPYTSSTLSLPISTYFSNGMKSAGNVYDELTPSKAITRVGSVDLGSLTWTYNSTYDCFTVNGLLNPLPKDAYNAVCSKYPYVGSYRFLVDKSCAYIYNNNIAVRDSSFTDAVAFKQAMTDQNVKLYYELATPIETSFTTASLVTENAEIPLSNEDGTLIGKCTEQLSENPGFIDAKIKLSDADGTCYSNKIQLHVERSPQ